MKTNASLLICLVSTLLLSCKNEKKEQFIPEIPSHTKLISNKKETLKLWKKAIHDGDFKAYNEISNAYLLHSQIYELYYYSLIMANKYKCPEAYYHLFSIMNDQMTIDDLSLYSDDKATKNMSLYYLLKSKELGYTHAQSHIDEIFGEGKTIPASSYYLKKSLNTNER